MLIISQTSRTNSHVFLVCLGISIGNLQCLFFSSHGNADIRFPNAEVRSGFDLWSRVRHILGVDVGGVAARPHTLKENLEKTGKKTVCLILLASLGPSIL